MQRSWLEVQQHGQESGIGSVPLQFVWSPYGPIIVPNNLYNNALCSAVHTPVIGQLCLQGINHNNNITTTNRTDLMARSNNRFDNTLAMNYNNNNYITGAKTQQKKQIDSGVKKKGVQNTLNSGQNFQNILSSSSSSSQHHHHHHHHQHQNNHGRKNKPCKTEIPIGPLQIVFQRLNWNELRSVRLVCKTWRSEADASVRHLKLGIVQSDFLRKFVNLESLDLSDAQPLRKRLLQIISKSCPRLKNLVIGSKNKPTWFTNEGIAALGNIKALEHIRFVDCNTLTRNGVHQLGNLCNLTGLELIGCKKVSGTSMGGLSPLQSSLMSLNVFDCRKINNSGVGLLNSLTSLTSLTLGLTTVKDEGLSALATMTNLKSLFLQGEEISTLGVMLLSELSGLTALSLRNCHQIEGGGYVQLLTNLSNLKYLDLYGATKLRDDHFEQFISVLKNLESLDVRQVAVSRVGSFSTLASLKGLQSVCLDMSQISMNQQQAQDQLAWLTKLSALQISKDMNWDYFMYWATNLSTSLKFLNLSRGLHACQILSPQQSRSMSVGISFLTSLEYLDLTNRQVLLQDLCYFLETLHKHALCTLVLYTPKIQHQLSIPLFLRSKFPAIKILTDEVPIDGLMDGCQAPGLDLWSGQTAYANARLRRIGTV